MKKPPICAHRRTAPCPYPTIRGSKTFLHPHRTLTGADFRRSGSTTLNVANVKGTGVLEMHVGGEGPVFNVGRGGTDVSFSTLAASYAGLRETARISGYKLGGRQGNAKLSAITMAGYSDRPADWLASRAVFEGHIGLEFGSGEDANGTRWDGKYDRGKPGTISMSNAFLEGPRSRETFARMASILSHEATHMSDHAAGRATREGAAYGNQAASYGSIAAKFGDVGERQYMGGLLRQMAAPENWQVNSGDVDYLKVVSRADGSHHVEAEYDEEGNLIKRLTLSTRSTREM